MLNQRLGSLTQLLIFPRWPVHYPDREIPRCFLIMPFSPELDIIHNVIENACYEAAVRFVRGDRAEGQDVIRSIWDEIGLATHIVVDLTGFNPNVCLELGMADTLGRPALLIGQVGTEKLIKRYLPSLAKRRLNKYRLEEPLEDRGFAAALNGFLA